MSFSFIALSSSGKTESVSSICFKEENICADKNEDCSQQCFGSYLYFNLLILIFGFLLVLN